MHILLLILKILGCVLLLLLILLILILLLVLLVPVRYQFSGSRYEGEMPKAQAAVTWFFSLICFNVAFGDHGLTYSLRAAWLKLFDSGEEENEEKPKDPEEVFSDSLEEDSGDSEKLDETDEAVSVDKEGVVSVTGISMEEVSETGPEKLEEAGATAIEDEEPAGGADTAAADSEPAGGADTAAADSEPAGGTDTAAADSEPAGVTESVSGEAKPDDDTEAAGQDVAETGPEEASDIEEITESAIDIKEESLGEVSPSGQAGPAPAGKEGQEAEDSLPDRLCRKIEEIEKKVEDKSVWLQEKYQQGEDLLNTFPPETYVPIVWDTTYKLLYHVMPRKLEGHVRYGFDDPYTTGRITSWTAILYPFYAGSFEVTPEFDRKILEGDLEGAGRIRLGFLLRLLIGLLLKKEVRFAICYVLKLRKKSRSPVKES